MDTLVQLESMWIKRCLSRMERRRKIPFALVAPDGAVTRFGGGDDGDGETAFRVVLRSARARRALARLDALSIAEAYMDGEIDVEGDLVAAMAYQELLGDTHPLIRLLSRVEPLVIGRARANPAWIGLHYDADNVQLMGLDRDYNTYTPGVYQDESESLEGAAERKLAEAFALLRLKGGDRLLEVGCGWGGMLRYAARRGVHVTGITLSRDQRAFCEELCRREQLDARVLYQDFFTYAPSERFDAISIMGVIEDLSDYRVVMRSLARWLRPGGRVYLDFAAERERFGTHSFVTKYIWPGTFRMVFMPEFIEAIRESPFELELIDNQRRNYHLWMRKSCERWAQVRDTVVSRHGDRVYRMLLLLWASIAANMDRASHSASAFRVILELPADSDGRLWTRPGTRVADALRTLVAAGREHIVARAAKIAGVARPSAARAPGAPSPGASIDVGARPPAAPTSPSASSVRDRRQPPTSPPDATRPSAG